MKNDVPFWIGALVTAAVLAIAPVPTWMIEQFYSRDFYPVEQGLVTSMSNAIPLAVLDLLLLVLLVLAVRWLVRFFKVWRDDGPVDAVWEIFRRVVRAVSVVAIFFLIMWGLNYRRIPLENALGILGPPPTVDELQSSIIEANSLAARERPLITATSAEGYEDLVRRLRMPFDAALKQLNRGPLQVSGRPKYSLILTPYFTAAGIDGMINPLALESIVHPDLLPMERPFVLAHEWAHLAGSADEAEASAIGWFACMKGDPVLAYSASLYLIGEAGSSLPPDRWRALVAKIDPGVRADLDAIAVRVARRQPAVQRAASRVYDSYLKANSIDDGVASYSRALTLILSPKLHDAYGQVR